MPSTKQFRDRIRSVSNTAKVTGAMQLIAASRMQRAQQMVIDGRAYAEKIQQILGGLASQSAGEGDDGPAIPLLEKRELKRAMMVLVTPDRGLAGALVGNLIRTAGTFIREVGVPIEVISVGRKGERFITRTGQELHATYSVKDRPALDDTVSVSRMLVDEYESGAVDLAVMVYAQFINTAVQKPVVKTLLPVEPPETAAEESDDFVSDYIFEPDPLRVLQTLVPRYIDTQIYHSILEAQASEHSARMVAMKNATDNANELIEDLTLDLNKARQEAITSELLDIVGGAAAVEA